MKKQKWLRWKRKEGYNYKRRTRYNNIVKIDTQSEKVKIHSFKFIYWYT